MLNILGVISVLLFYLLILIVGIWVGRKVPKNGSEEQFMLAGRNFDLFVGICSMTATWVGRGFNNRTAGMIYTYGLVHCQAPFGYALSLVICGLMFAKPLRKNGYVTMLDPLQDAFGERMGALLFAPALFFGEVLWAAGTLTALGSMFVVIIGMDRNISVILTACIALSYTLFGGFYSVAYTDVVKMFCIFIGLWLCVPYALTHHAAESLTDSLYEVDWIGKIEPEYWSFWIEDTLMLIFGGVLSQTYFQRILSTQTPARAQIVSFVAAFGCIIMALPPMLFGVIVHVSDWSKSEYGKLHEIDPASPDESNTALLLLMRHFTPNFVWLFGLGAFSAVQMSSVDSRVLSASSLFTRNVYKRIFRRSASATEVVWVTRISILVVGTLATVMALTISKHTYDLWPLCFDLVYMIVFPQLLMVTHFPNYCNTFGSLAAFVVALVGRLGGGVHFLGLKALIHYPYYEPENDKYFEYQRFPFKTLSMLVSLVTLGVVSKLTDWMFDCGIINLKYHYRRHRTTDFVDQSEMSVLN